MPDEQTAPPSQEPASSKRDQVLAELQRIYKQGQYIEFDESDEAAYIVHDGEVQVITTIVVDGKSHEIELATLRKGSYLNGYKFFGIEAEQSYKVRFRTLSRVVLIRFTKDRLPDPLNSAEERDAFSKLYISFLRSSYAEKASLVQGIIDERCLILRQEDKTDANRMQNLRAQLAEKDSTIHNLEEALIQSSRSAVSEQIPDAEKIQSLQASLKQAELRAQNAKKLVTRLQRALKNAELNNFRLMQNQGSAVADTFASLQAELNEARQAQTELEQRITTMQSQSQRPKSKFSQTEALLNAEALKNLEEAETKRRKASEYFEQYARRMHRAFELICEDNPNLVFADDARMLWLGEEPPPRQSIVEQRRVKNSVTNPAMVAVLATTAQEPPPADPDTAVLGSCPPELARPQKSNKTTDRMQPRDPRAEAEDIAGTNPGATDGDPVTDEINSLLQGYLFNKDDTPPADDDSREFNWEPDVPDNAPRETIPFDPDEDHPAENSDVKIPKPPLSVRAESLIDPESIDNDQDDSWDDGQTAAWSTKEVPTRPSPQEPENADPCSFPADEPDTHTRQILEDASLHPFSGHLPDTNLRRPVEFIPDGVVSPPSSDDLEDYTRPYGIPRPPDVPGPKKT